MSPLLLLAAWISGTAALVAEVLWFRGLGRGVGTSAEALAVVSAAFLGGLGLGAAIASRLVRRSIAPLRSAALCEVLAGALVFLSPFAIALVPSAHLSVLHALGLKPGPSAWPAALVAIPILMLPTTFLGATLPFLVRGRVEHLDQAGRWTGRIYAVNTIGAACGVALATWFLLPRFGEVSSLRIAGGGNLLAALLLLLVAERPALSSALPPTSTPLPLPPVGSRGAPGPRAALFLSGTLALGAEVAWFRFLEPIAGVHVYGLAVLLGAVLVGTACGGAVGGWAADRVRRPDLAMAAALGFGGLLTVVSVIVVGAIPWLSVRAASAAAEAARAAKASADAIADAGLSAMFRTKLAGIALAVVPPLAAFAAAYPLAVRARARTAVDAAAAAGSVYAWNTVGNVVGSLLAGFWLLPHLGGSATLAALGGFGLLGAAILWWFASPPRPVLGALAFLVPLAFLSAPGATKRLDAAGPPLPEVVAMGKWYDTFKVRSREDMRVLSSVIAGTYPKPPGHPDAPPVLPRDGVTSSVGVLLERGSIRLRQGGLSESKILPSDPDAGSETEVALGLIPYLAHAKPETALLIGHGAGWTVETLLASGLTTVDVAEIEPAVLETVEEVRGRLIVRTDPKARLHFTDGRLLLREAADKGGTYDLVVSQPSHPWVPGAGHLFTRDAYKLARKALKPGGVFAQWLNIFNMTPALFRTALASWADVFKDDSWLFLFNDEIVLVGFTSPPTIDVARWSRAIEREPVGERARAAGILSAEDLLRRMTLDGEGLARLLGTQRTPSTDDEPRLETGLARVQFLGEEGSRKERDAARAAIYQDLRRAFPPKFATYVPDAVARDALLARTAERALAAGGLDEGRRWLTAVPFEGGVLGRRVRARERLATANLAKTSPEEATRLRGEAADLLLSAVATAPNDPDLAVELLEALSSAGRSKESVERGEALAAKFPEHGPLLAEWARSLIAAGDEVKADEAFRLALLAHSPPPPAGTGLRRARLLTSAPPLRSAEARDALRSDPSTFTDRDALTSLLRLEIELGPISQGPEETEIVRTLQAQLKEAEHTLGVEKLAVAEKSMDSDPTGGRDAAGTAVSMLPESALAWRLKGWYELRAKETDAGIVSLRKAISLARDPDAETRLAKTYLRLFGQDPSKLEEQAP